MNIARLRDLVAKRAGVPPPTRRFVATLFPTVALNADVLEYLHYCVADENLAASGLNVAGLDRLVQENLQEAGPGCFVYPHGFLVIATSVGGNALCLDAATSGVYWLEPSSFSDYFIVFQDTETGELRQFEEYTPDNIRAAGKMIGKDIGPTLEALFRDELTESLDRLD